MLSHSDESFITLKEKSDHLQEIDEKLVLGIVMVLRRRTQFIMVVMLQKYCKLPIGHFSVDAETKANLLRKAFVKLQKGGMTTCSLTLDGPSDHFVIVQQLGGRMCADAKKAKKKRLKLMICLLYFRYISASHDV